MSEEDATKRSTKTKKNEETKQIIYCGPDIGNILRQNTVFTGNVPRGVEEHIEKCPEIQRLFTSIAQANMLKVAINDNGSTASIFYDKILDYAKELR